MTPYYSDDAVTLYHGDCREVTAWLEADVLVADPPYGVSYDSRKPGVVGEKITGDTDTSLREAALEAWGGRPALVFGTWRVPRPAGTDQVLIWWKRETKNLAFHSGRKWAYNFEEIYTLGPGWLKAADEPAQHAVIPTDEHRSANYGAIATLGHPTPKPLVLMEQLLERCPPGVIADPFAGSGATLLAARALGRRAIGVEVEERYCELIAKRLAQGALNFGGAA
jgi:site-specific DNA-methyltransferase (adenine-specific)